VTDGTRAALRVPLAPNDNLGAVSTQAPCSRPPGEAARHVPATPPPRGNGLLTTCQATNIVPFLRDPLICD